MSTGTPINSARRTKSYAAAAVQDDDGIKTSFATVAAPVTLVPADFNGAAIAAGGVLDLPRTVTITRSSNTDQFSVLPHVITGKRGGQIVTESWTPANNDGNDVFRGTQPFDTITSIALPTQDGTGGTFKIGVQDICCPAGQHFTGVKLDTAGPLNVQYGEVSGSATDTINATAGNIEPISPSRIRTSPALSAPTVAALTVYLP